MTNKSIFKNTINIAILIILAVATVCFSVLTLSMLEQEFVVNNLPLISTLISIIIASLTIISIVFQLKNKEFIFKLAILLLSFMTIVLVLAYILLKSGFWDKIDSVEDLRMLISHYGAYTIPIFILFQILGTTILPIPGFVAIGTGVALFGPFYGSIYSFIGVWIGSVASFFIGRKLGYKVSTWLVGKESLDKGLAMVKGKDKALLTFMFLFPFFPDDVLCFVAGLSTMSVKYYLWMITLTRIFGIVVSSYSFNGSIIPYNTWWGILIWVAVFAIIIIAGFIIYKNATKIEAYLRNKFKKKADK